MSLARLWQSQGRGGAARGLLTGVRDRFSEGFGTVDQERAASLLEALADNGRTSAAGPGNESQQKLRILNGRRTPRTVHHLVSSAEGSPRCPTSQALIRSSVHWFLSV